VIAELFDDHSEALGVWRQAGLSGLTCLHVDAHLDVMEEGFDSTSLAGLAALRSRSELAAFRGDSRRPWGGLHCGNYLYPALLDGTVTHLIWLLPPAVLPPGSMLDAVRQEVARGVDLTLEEYSSFRLVQSSLGCWVEGTLLGRSLTVCSSQSLPELPQGKLALDIDVDYFVNLSDDRIWQTPHQLWHALGPLSPSVLTVALSCEGGYTPPQHRYLGQVCLDVFSGQPWRWRKELAAMLEAQQNGAWEGLLDSAPAAWKPAVLSQLGRHREAALLDPEYRGDPLNLAARLLQKGDFEGARRALAGSADPQADRLLQTALMASSDPLWDQQRLSATAEGSSGPELARFWRAQGEALLRAGRAGQAVALLKKAQQAEPLRAATLLSLARALHAAGQPGGAGRHLRKALELSRGRLSSLPVLLEACRLYQQSGQDALARQARKELEASDVTGMYLAQLLLDRPSR
jgi:hypothetical protein